jgi:ribosome-associated protein
METVTPMEIARIAAVAADSKKATDILLLDLEGLSDVCDYFLICTAANARMLSSVVDEIEEKVKKNTGLGPLSQEGRAGASWVLLDYGSVVVHVFLEETRDYYRLERLWGDAPQVDLGLGE